MFPDNDGTEMANLIPIVKDNIRQQREIFNIRFFDALSQKPSVCNLIFYSLSVKWLTSLKIIRHRFVYGHKTRKIQMTSHTIPHSLRHTEPKLACLTSLKPMKIKIKIF